MQGMRIGIEKTTTLLRGWSLPLLAVLLALSGCSPDAPAVNADGDLIQIVATTSIIGDVVSNIVGDTAAVEVVLPAGTDPHDFAPSPQQVASINDADLVVANGLGLEESLTDIIESAASEGTPVLRVAEGVDPLPASVEGNEAEASTGDPHFWHDPDRMAEAIDLVVDELSALDDSVDWASQAADYRDDVTRAGVAADEILSVVPAERRSLVTSHDSLDYFADRFGFEVVATVIPGGGTLAEPSGQEIADLVDTIDEAGVSAIFTDATNPTNLAETVATEAGREISVVEIFNDSLGEPGSGAETYLEMILTNAGLVAEALSAK